jgi:propionyl-CoA synthetase
MPVPGYDLRIFNEQGVEVPPNEEGAVVIKAPLPPGALPTVWGDHERYHDAYWSQFDGFYFTGDEGYRDEDGYVYIMGRMDDVINVAGHRLSTGQMEEILAEHPAVAECAVVGIADPDKGQVPLGLLLLKDGINISPEALEQELVQSVRRSVGAFANFKRAVVVNRLPKTRSGKILRATIRKMIDGKPYSIPSTIDDPAIIGEIEARLKERGAM